LAFIPEECYLQYVIWHAPQETGEQVKREIEAQIHRYAQLDPWLRANPPELDWQDFWWPPYDISPEAPICQAATHAYQEVLNMPAKACGFLGVDDASFLNQAGIPTITLGPGDARTAHSANESVEIRDLVDATKIFALTIADWCGV
jgi:acetylornithine deacetylase/succinyl-diaminopimelate desuccinylase-like protein